MSVPSPRVDGHVEVVLPGPGPWVPLPPTELAEGRTRRETPPGEYDWHLPDAHLVQAAILAGLRRQLVA